MKVLARLFLVIALALGAIAQSALAGDTDPLFVNDKGVLIGSKAHSAKYADHRRVLGDLMAKGATVLICPMCMKYYSVKEGDLLSGLKVGTPELTGAAVFKDNTKSLTG